MIINEIRETLSSLRDTRYREMQIRIIPTLPPERVIGVRTPALRKLAKECAKRPDVNAFLDQLPHHYFEENQLHAFIIALNRDYDACLTAVNRFLPWVDNWATCDQMSPGAFKNRLTREAIEPWLRSEHSYTQRFGIKMLMDHYLDQAFDPACLQRVASIRSDDYYVRMMIAWYFATALAKQYEAAVVWIEDKTLDRWVHNKAIQKAIESFRIPPDRKAYLRGLKAVTAQGIEKTKQSQ